MRSENSSFEQLRAAPALGDQLFADKPLLVISRAIGGYRPIREIVSEEQVAMLVRERVEHNADLLHLSRNSGAMVASDSGHDVHLDRPEIVTKAIGNVTGAVNRHSILKP